MMSDRFDLHGKAALVTGASSGIGLHTARTLARAGAAVALCARRIDKLETAVSKLRQEGHRACAVGLDVTVAESIPRAWSACEKALGQPIDILFNNAGILYVEKFLKQEPAEVDRIFATNLKGNFLVAQEGAQRMVKHGSGVIINVASTAGVRAGGHLSSYGASKAGLIHLTRIMALELATKGIRVNALAPGNLETDMHDKFDDAGFAETITKRIPMRRLGRPDDLDGATLLLASDAGAYITGAVIPIDGGQLLTWM